MKSNLKISFILIYLTIGIMSGYSQKCDTTFYMNKNIRSVEIKKDGENIFQEFYSEKGENLLTNESFHYEYFDSIMGMSRIIDVENKKMKQEFWVSDRDTIYNYAKFEPDFDKKLAKFFNYVSNNLVYPTEAYEKHIEGRVMLSFIVDKKGMIREINPLTKLGYGLEKSSIELLMKYKKWGIIYLNSKPINVFFRLPITYKF